MNVEHHTTQIEPVVVVIVTYGDRWGFLKDVLTRLVSDEYVAECVVVDNGAKADIRMCVAAEGWASRVKVLTQTHNTGSATGFADGIAFALANTHAEWLYLLDDDNRPELGAILLLLQQLCTLDADKNICLLSLRPARPEQFVALETSAPIRHQTNAFMGFHIGAAMTRVFSRKPVHEHEAPVNSIDVEFAPYGGLLFHRSWVDRVGLPKREYFVYSDDHDFTTRIVKAGGRIILLRASRIEDLETAWYLTNKAKSAGFFSSSIPNFRLYYQTRNRVDFERRELIDSRFIYFLNFGLFFVIQYSKAIAADRSLYGPTSKIRVALAAFSDGWRGLLGRNKLY
jgi:GT2 family glycosyltransferase